jgi:hypothetical protein
LFAAEIDIAADGYCYRGPAILTWTRP